MRWITNLWFRLKALVVPGRLERELDDEMAFHLEMEAGKHVNEGMAPDAARHEALRRFGSPVREKERAREAWGVSVVQDVVADLRFAWRQLARNPAFGVTAILTLGLGIGAATAMFTVVNAVLLRPLPFDAPDRIVRVYTTIEGREFGTAANPDIDDWRERVPSLESVSVAHGWRATLLSDHGPQELRGLSVNAGYFALLGVRPAGGRFFTPDEDVAGHDPVVVLSYGLWQREFGGDPAVIGRAIVLSDLRGEASYVVIGVAPRDYESPLAPGLEVDMWRSTQAYWTRWNRQNNALPVIARLRDGVDVATAQRELDLVAAQLTQEYPQTNATKTWRPVPVRDVLLGNVRPMVLVLFGAVGLLLLIAAANVANLLLARATARTGEIAVRLSLGASRRRLARQLLTESLVLATCGGALGLGLALVGVPSLLALAGEGIPRLDAVRVDRTALVFAGAITIGVAMLFGLAPAVSASHGRLAGVLRESGRGGAGLKRPLIRRLLVTVEIAMSLVLLAGAGLLLRSYANLAAVPTGVRTQGVLTLRIAPAATSQPDERLDLYYRNVQDRLAALPGVTAVGATSRLPLSGGPLCTGVVLGVRESPIRDWHERCIDYRSVTEGYARSVGLTLVRGRWPDGGDYDPGAGPAPSLINETAARIYFPDGDAVGRFLTTGIGTSHEVVGVLRDIPLYGRADPVGPALFIPHARAPGWVQRAMYLIVQTSGEPLALLPAVRQAIWAVDGAVPITRVRTLEDVLGMDGAQPRFRTILLAIFAALATVLATIGVAGLMAYTVAQRRGELAVRMALGARNADVVRLVVRSALSLAGLGIAAGLLGAVACVRLMRSLLFGVEALDPVTFGAVVLLLGLIVVTASWLPGRRAASVDPARALRAE